MKILSNSEQALAFWHERIGRFMSDEGAHRALKKKYLKLKGTPKAQDSLGMAKTKKQIRAETEGVFVCFGQCGASLQMMDSKSAVLIDELDFSGMPGVASTDCDFLVGANIKGQVSVTKTQINWALSPDRVYPLLMIRPGRRALAPCLQLSLSPRIHVVCAPQGNFQYDAIKVREARDYIVGRNLEKSWVDATKLRVAIALNEHMSEGVGDIKRQKMLDMHSKLLELFPLEVWLPVYGTGDYEALSNALAEKDELPLSSLIKARDVFLKSKTLTETK